MIRDEQRRIYEQRRRDILPEHGIWLVEISYADLKYDRCKRLVRDRQNDLAVIRRMLQADDISRPHSATAVSEKADGQSWIYHAYQRFGCMFIIAVIAATLLLSRYLSIRVFRLNDIVSCIVIIATLFIVGFICHHYTTDIDRRMQSKSAKNSYGVAAIPPVCCPVCGIHNIGPADNGDYVCIDCSLKWRQTY